MEEQQSLGEQITRHLLVGGNQYTNEIRGHNPGNYDSSVTGVLLFSSFIAVCGSLNYGLAVGYSSPVESKIIDELALSTAEYSLFGSFLTIGGALGAIASGKMSDYLGRRATFGVADVLSIAGWVAIVVSQGVLPLYLGRSLLGFALGLTAYVVPIYIAEIAPKDLRGGFVILHMFMACAGIAMAYILGVFISWRLLAAVGIIPNFSQLICLFFIPESPRWLAKVHKENKFNAALQRLRGSSANISEEAADIKVLSISASLLLTDRLGRRPLMMVSASGVFLACLLTGISFVLEDHALLQGYSSCMTLIGLLMFCAFYAIGIGGISFLLISEIYPMNIKGLAGSLVTLVGWITSWFVSYVFNFSLEWSSAGTFFILTGICAFMVVFVVKLVPETKGRTLEEIQASVNKMFHSDH